MVSGHIVLWFSRFLLGPFKKKNFKQPQRNAFLIPYWCISTNPYPNRINTFSAVNRSPHLNGFRLGLHIFHSLRGFLADIGNGAPIYLARQREPYRGSRMARKAVSWLPHRLEMTIVWRWMSPQTKIKPTACSSLFFTFLITLQLVHPQ